jgi:hypothetical protein
MADTNTQGYAGTARYKSGISIEVGTYEKNMAVTMTLAGATGTNSDAMSTKSTSATTAATPSPTPAPTPGPVSSETTATCTKPAQVSAGGYGCPSTESVAMTCSNLSTATFLITGIGASDAARAKFQTKTCGVIGSVSAQTKHCGRLDYSKTDSTKVNHPYIWQICQKECKVLSKCA